jgi:hypothetical protein
MRNYLQILKAFTLTALMFVSFGKANASHFMGGDITYVCIGPNQYSVVAKLFRDCDGITLPQTITINVNSPNCGYNGNVQLSNLGGALNSYIAPICGDKALLCNQSFPANGVGVEQYFYRGIMTLPACANGSDFELSWSTCCRNGIITTGAANAGNYLYATLNNTLAQCNNSPAFNFEPTLYFCVGQENQFNQGVTDIDGDDLQFSFTECLDQGSTSTNPISVTYTPPFSATNPLTTSSISIDAQTGQISMIPTQLEVGVFCVKVEEFRSGVKISETIRDLQVAVVDCGMNTLPVLSGFNGAASSGGTTGSFSYTGCVGEEIEFDIQSFDAQGQPGVETQTIFMTWGIGISKASFIIDDTSSTLPSATFSWIPTAADVGTNFFTVKIEDDACPINGISVFTYKINIQASGLNYSTPMPSDTIVCDTSGLVINVNKSNFGPGYQFFWSTNTVDSVLSCYNCEDPVFTPLPNVEATYEFYMTYRNVGSTTNCVIKDTFTVTVESCDTTNTNSIDNLVQMVQISPNPISTNATLSYRLNQSSDVRVEVYDMIGRQVATLANQKQNSGMHRVEIGDAINRVKGIYFVRLSIDGQVMTKKVLVQ